MLGTVPAVIAGVLAKSRQGLQGMTSAKDNSGSPVTWDNWSKYVDDKFASAVQAEREWSKEQAQKQMEFQREMSTTQYQRAVDDLRKAGLNPILTATKGVQPAGIPAGAMGTTSAQQVYKDNDSMQMVLALLAHVVNTANNVFSSTMGSASKVASAFA